MSWWPWKKEKLKCPCGKDLGKNSAVIQYRCLDPESQNFVMNNMAICSTCADELDAKAEEEK